MKLYIIWTIDGENPKQIAKIKSETWNEVD